MIPFLLVALASSPSARAGSAASEVESYVLAPDAAAPDLAIACAPQGALVERVAPILAMLQATAGLPSDGDRARFWLGLFEPGGLEAAGLDPAGAIVLAAWIEAQAARARIDFRGTPDQAEAMLRQIGSATVEKEGDGWMVSGQKDHVRARLEGGAIHFEQGQVPAASRPAPSELVGGLSTGPACVMVMDPAKGDDLPFQSAASIPLAAGEPMLVRVRLDQPAPAALDAVGAAPVGGTSSLEPLAVLALGVPVLDLLDDPAVSGLLKLDPARLAPIAKRVRIGAGTTVAVFGTPKAFDFAAVLPLQDPNGRPMSAKAIAKGSVALLESQELPVARTSKTAFRVSKGEKLLYGSAADGRLVIGTHAAIVEEAARGDGKPWLDAEHTSWAGRWPISAALLKLPPETGLPPVRFQWGVRSRGGLWEGAIDGQLEGSDEAGPAAVAGMLAAIAVPNFLEMQKRAKASEARRTVDSLYIAEEAYFAEHGAYVTLPAAPRAVSELDGEAIPWVASPEWATVGWAPSGSVRGAYWVEVAADGATCTVNGAMDLDDDGEPAIWQRTTGEGSNQITAPGEY